MGGLQVYRAKSNIPKMLLSKIGSNISTEVYNTLPELHKTFYDNSRPTSTPCSNHAFEEDDENSGELYRNDIYCGMGYGAK